MELITQDIARQLQTNFRQRHRDGHDPEPVVKLFTPDAQATWLVTEQDPDDPDLLFGVADLGLGFPELGYISLSELQSVRGALGLPGERDLYFTPRGTIGAYLADAKAKQYLDTHCTPGAPA